MTKEIQAVARVLVKTALDLIQADAHQWSERPCTTCRTIGSILGEPFGCYLYAEQRRRQRLKEQGAKS